eukprot:11016089-Ditylum_brightwellii.AAC.1
MFDVGETVEYIAGKDSELVKITSIDEGIEQDQFTVVGKSNMPFNVGAKKLRRVAVPDAGFMPSKGNVMQTSQGLTTDQCEKILKPNLLTPLQQEYLS